MNKKTKKYWRKVRRWTITGYAVVGAIAVTLFGRSLYAVIINKTGLSSVALLVISSAVLILLVVSGVISFKKIQQKLGIK